jgi:hypothetical protein
MKSTLSSAILFTIAFSLAAQHDGSHKILRDLDFLVGQWKVEVDARLSAQGPWEKSEGKAVITLTLDSALIEEEFKGTREGKPFNSKTLLAANNQTNRYQQVFIDGPHGTLIDFEGVMENNKFIFDKTWSYANGRTVKLRMVYGRESPDIFTVESLRWPEGAPGWDTTGRKRYTRVK